MTKSAMEIIEDQEKKIVFLENKLKNVLKLIEILVSGNPEKAKSSLSDPTGITDVVLKQLVEKFEAFSSSLPKQDEKTDLFLKIIIESMPFPVFIKDENSRYLYVNGHEAALFRLTEEALIGKHDSEFVKDREEMEIITRTDEEILLHKKSIELPKQKFSLANGVSYVFKTHKLPFVNPFTKRTNILGFSVDVTDTVNLEKLKKILAINSNPYL